MNLPPHSDRALAAEGEARSGDTPAAPTQPPNPEAAVPTPSADTNSAEMARNPASAPSNPSTPSAATSTTPTPASTTLATGLTGTPNVNASPRQTPIRCAEAGRSSALSGLADCFSAATTTAENIGAASSVADGGPSGQMANDVVQQKSGNGNSSRPAQDPATSASIVPDEEASAGVSDESAEQSTQNICIPNLTKLVNELPEDGNIERRKSVDEKDRQVKFQKTCRAEASSSNINEIEVEREAQESERASPLVPNMLAEASRPESPSYHNEPNTDESNLDEFDEHAAYQAFSHTITSSTASNTLTNVEIDEGFYKTLEDIEFEVAVKNASMPKIPSPTPPASPASSSPSSSRSSSPDTMRRSLRTGIEMYAFDLQPFVFETSLKQAMETIAEKTEPENEEDNDGAWFDETEEPESEVDEVEDEAPEVDDDMEVDELAADAASNAESENELEGIDFDDTEDIEGVSSNGNDDSAEAVSERGESDDVAENMDVNEDGHETEGNQAAGTASEASDDHLEGIINVEIAEPIYRPRPLHIGAEVVDTDSNTPAHVSDGNQGQNAPMSWALVPYPLSPVPPSQPQSPVRHQQDDPTVDELVNTVWTVVRDLVRNTDETVIRKMATVMAQEAISSRMQSIPHNCSICDQRCFRRLIASDDGDSNPDIASSEDEESVSEESPESMESAIETTSVTGEEAEVGIEDEAGDSIVAERDSDDALPSSSAKDPQQTPSDECQDGLEGATASKLEAKIQQLREYMAIGRANNYIVPELLAQSGAQTQPVAQEHATVTDEPAEEVGSSNEAVSNEFPLSDEEANAQPEAKPDDASKDATLSSDTEVEPSEAGAVGAIESAGVADERKKRFNTSPISSFAAFPMFPARIWGWEIAGRELLDEIARQRAIRSGLLPPVNQEPSGQVTLRPTPRLLAVCNKLIKQLAEAKEKRHQQREGRQQEPVRHIENTVSDALEESDSTQKGQQSPAGPEKQTPMDKTIVSEDATQSSIDESGTDEKEIEVPRNLEDESSFEDSLLKIVEELIEEIEYEKELDRTAESSTDEPESEADNAGSTAKETTEADSAPSSDASEQKVIQGKKRQSSSESELVPEKKRANQKVSDQPAASPSNRAFSNEESVANTDGDMQIDEKQPASDVEQTVPSVATPANEQAAISAEEAQTERPVEALVSNNVENVAFATEIDATEPEDCVETAQSTEEQPTREAEEQIAESANVSMEQSRHEAETEEGRDDSIDTTKEVAIDEDENADSNNETIKVAPPTVASKNLDSSDAEPASKSDLTPAKQMESIVNPGRSSIQDDSVDTVNAVAPEPATVPSPAQQPSPSRQNGVFGDGNNTPVMPSELRVVRRLRELNERDQLPPRQRIPSPEPSCRMDPNDESNARRLQERRECEELGEAASNVGSIYTEGSVENADDANAVDQEPILNADTEIAQIQDGNLDEGAPQDGNVDFDDMYNVQPPSDYASTSEEDEVISLAITEVSEASAPSSSASSRRRRRISSTSSDDEPAARRPRQLFSMEPDAMETDDYLWCERCYRGCRCPGIPRPIGHRDDLPPPPPPPEPHDDPAPPPENPPQPPRRRRRQNEPVFGRLQHIDDIEGIDLPNAPPVVVNQRKVYEDVSLAADQQVGVLRGEHFTLALYESGAVVFQGFFEGGSTASAQMREAARQPIMMFNHPLHRIVQVAIGPNHVVMRSEDGDIYTVGRSREGQLGVNNPRRYRQSALTPEAMHRPIMNGSERVVIQNIRVEGNTTYATSDKGVEYRCGEGFGPLFAPATAPPASTDDDEEEDDE